jgi:hypothetical protein
MATDYTELIPPQHFRLIAQKGCCNVSVGGHNGSATSAPPRRRIDPKKYFATDSLPSLQGSARMRYGARRFSRTLHVGLSGADRRVNAEADARRADCRQHLYVNVQAHVAAGTAMSCVASPAPHVVYPDVSLAFS